MQFLENCYLECAIETMATELAVNKQSQFHYFYNDYGANSGDQP